MIKFALIKKVLKFMCVMPLLSHVMLISDVS